MSKITAYIVFVFSFICNKFNLYLFLSPFSQNASIIVLFFSYSNFLLLTLEEFLSTVWSTSLSINFHELFHPLYLIDVTNFPVTLKNVNLTQFIKRTAPPPPNYHKNIVSHNKISEISSMGNKKKRMYKALILRFSYVLSTSIIFLLYSFWTYCWFGVFFQLLL